MLPWKLRKRHILPVNQNLSSVYFSLAKFQLVSCNLSLAMHDLANDICSQTSKTVFSHLRQLQVNLKKICGTFTSLTTRTKLQTSKALNATKHFSLMRMSTQESIFEFAMTAELKKEDAFFTALASI